MKAIDLSIVVTFHKEGLLAKYMLDGLLHNRMAAEAKGVATQLVCVLDSADADTTRIVSAHRTILDTDIIIDVCNGDPALSRNAGVAVTNGRFVSIVDGDDYYSRDWLWRAFAEAERNSAAIVHPQWVLSFGAINCLENVRDQRQTNYPVASLLKYNPWVITSLAARDIYIETPYVAARCADTGFAFEDWHWNISVQAKGHLHITAKDTALIYRRKQSGSVLAEQSLSRGIIGRSDFFAKWKEWNRVFGAYA